MIQVTENEVLRSHIKVLMEKLAPWPQIAICVFFALSILKVSY
jgi:hypothetical protein